MLFEHHVAHRTTNKRHGSKTEDVIDPDIHHPSQFLIFPHLAYLSRRTPEVTKVISTISSQRERTRSHAQPMLLYPIRAMVATVRGDPSGH